MTVGSIIGGGFRLLRERPGAVGVWGLIYFALTVATTMAMRPIFMPGPQAGAVAGNFGTHIGWFALIELAVLVVWIALMAAAQRAVLHPERSAFAYLRIGLDELRLFLLAIILIVMFYIAFALVGLVLVAITGLLAVSAGTGAMGPVAMLEGLLMIGLFLWFEVRLALAFPLTLLRGKIIIGEAWRISRGHFWTLLGAFLLLGLIVLILAVAGAAAGNGSYFGDLMRSGLTPNGLQAASQHQLQRLYGPPDARMVIGWAVSALVGTIILAVSGGALATAVRELTGNLDEVAETFA
jgi:hypothetical protein